MRWNDIAPERRNTIIDAAAARLAADDDEVMQPSAADHVTIADLADYARGRPLRKSMDSICLALRTDPGMREAFDLLFNRYAMVSIEVARAASTGTASKRRQAEAGVEIEWLESSAEPNTIFVRVHAPAPIRPVRELVMRGGDGEMRAIALIDEGGDIEVLLDRASLEFSLLANENSKLWLR